MAVETREGESEFCDWGTATLAARLFCGITAVMAKSIRGIKNKRGRPATAGAGTPNHGSPSTRAAFSTRCVDIRSPGSTLSSRSYPPTDRSWSCWRAFLITLPQDEGRAQGSRGMAGREIDRHGDRSATGEEPPAGNEDCFWVRKSSATYGGNDRRRGTERRHRPSLRHDLGCLGQNVHPLRTTAHDHIYSKEIRVFQVCLFACNMDENVSAIRIPVHVAGAILELKISHPCVHAGVNS